jgi:hypothetical protein
MTNWEALEPHPDNHYHLDDTPRYELTGDEIDPEYDPDRKDVI